jgi:hypothetical protein
MDVRLCALHTARPVCERVPMTAAAQLHPHIRSPSLYSPTTITHLVYICSRWQASSIECVICVTGRQVLMSDICYYSLE